MTRYDLPSEVKEEIKKRLNDENQCPSSVLLAMESKHHLNLSSRKIYNLKEKDLGVRNKLMKFDNEVDSLLCDSSMLVKHLSADPNVACVDQCESMSTLKSSKHQMKSFGITKLVDVVGDVCEFREKTQKSRFLVRLLIKIMPAHSR